MEPGASEVGDEFFESCILGGKYADAGRNFKWVPKCSAIAGVANACIVMKVTDGHKAF